jgi:DNA-binding response OmpR family regulator
MRSTPMVLVVEDSRTQAARLAKQLTDYGVEVVVAYDGLEGLKLATEYLPDIIVLDVKMPGMDGVQVCQRLKRHKDTVNIPVVMLSASDDPESTMAGLNAGAEDYIPKDMYAANYLIDTLRSFDY